MQKVMRADIYDYLELCSLAYGGIGWGKDASSYYKKDLFYFPDRPNCIHGMARIDESNEVSNELYSLGISRSYNDRIVNNILYKKGVSWLDDSHLHYKVTWEEYCKEASIIRGE